MEDMVRQLRALAAVCESLADLLDEGQAPDLLEDYGDDIGQAADFVGGVVEAAGLLPKLKRRLQAVRGPVWFRANWKEIAKHV